MVMDIHMDAAHEKMMSIRTEVACVYHPRVLRRRRTIIVQYI